MQPSLSLQQKEQLSQSVGAMPAATFSEMHDALRGERNFIDPHMQMVAALAIPLYPADLSPHQKALVKREVALATLGSSKLDIPPLQRAVGEELRDLIHERAAAAGLPTTTNPTRQMVSRIAQENAYADLKEEALDVPTVQVPPTLSFKERAARHFLGISGAFEEFKQRDVERLFKRAELDSPAADAAFMAGKQLASMMGEDYRAMDRNRFMAALYGIPTDKINGITEIESGTAATVRGVANLYGTVHESKITRSVHDRNVQHTNLTKLAASVAPTYIPPPVRSSTRSGKPFRLS